jgi:glycosyltransferase involved in cell wall biosynthesis
MILAGRHDDKTAPEARRSAMPDPPHVLHVFPSFGLGGVPIRIATIVNDLGAAFRHTVIALDGAFASRSRIEPAVRIAYLDPEIDKARPLQGAVRVLATLRRLRPDLLVTYNWGSIEWAAVNRLARVAPHLHLESGFGPDEAERQIGRRVRARRFALARARRVVVPSHSLVRIATEVWRLDPGRIAYVANGVDCERFAAPPDPALVPGLTRRDGEVVVGTVAPLRAEKNLGRLVRAFARVAPGRNARLLLVGDGPERAGLARLAAELGIADRTLLPGHVERPERVYGLMDVFAMSSDTEQMPNSLIQAMAAGRAVVATDVGDVRRIVAPENGSFVVPCADEAAYDRALARLIDDAALRADLAERNQARAREVYPQERMFAAYRAIFAEATSRNGTRAA